MDTRFLRTSDTDSDMDSDKVMTSETGMSENLGHGLGHACPLISAVSKNEVEFTV